MGTGKERLEGCMQEQGLRAREGAGKGKDVPPVGPQLPYLMQLPLPGSS